MTSTERIIYRNMVIKTVRMPLQMQINTYTEALTSTHTLSNPRSRFFMLHWFNSLVQMRSFLACMKRFYKKKYSHLYIYIYFLNIRFTNIKMLCLSLFSQSFNQKQQFLHKMALLLRISRPPSRQCSHVDDWNWGNQRRI